MIDDYRFFQEFFDGQIVKEETYPEKLFKVLLFSGFSILGFFFFFAGWCSVIPLILFELGLIWNIYMGLGKRLNYLLCIVVAFLYFYVATTYAVYVNALIYVACYIPLQLIATGKDYSEGDFVQIKKKISDFNKILLVIFYVVLFMFLYLLDYNFGSRFIWLDVLSASLLVCSALLRNERYLEYYVFRIFALASSIVLWIVIAMEYSSTEAILIVLMYVAYLIYDVVNYFIQTKTYLNQMMVRVNEFKAEQNKELVEKKLEEYNAAAALSEAESAPSKPKVYSNKPIPKPRKLAPSKTKSTKKTPEKTSKSKSKSAEKKVN